MCCPWSMRRARRCNRERGLVLPSGENLGVAGEGELGQAVEREEGGLQGLGAGSERAAGLAGGERGHDDRVARQGKQAEQAVHGHHEAGLLPRLAGCC